MSGGITGSDMTMIKDVTIRVCFDCKRQLSLNNFHADVSRLYHKGYRCKECASINRKLDTLKLRRKVLALYGNQCICCGESQYEFLSLDHVNGGGRKHRENINKGGHTFYAWLLKQEYQPNVYQILCHNCNLAKGFYGQCPHEEVGVKNVAA